ncbi:hypothetical protein MSKOL_2890 [Methanosarcina sp. Kolksee]|uniref:PKD domain-containing protein n=1 Tax=Methanosarcina sp. Kolksee TaxID=1434099 RepID=UPI000615EC0A|nr:PKD domain-containing protein [Methanosarcina sp. Kolksee]AKB48667.1 hypothetical protein MSKOL_2890 [Methanosarcina sp. Kolksee]
MKFNEKLNSVALVSVALILFLIFVSSTTSAATEQSASYAGTYAYITDRYSDTVSVIDTSTNAVTAKVPVGNHPSGVAVSPTGTKVYVVNSDSGSVSVIDTTTNTVTATVSVERGPYGVAVSPNGKKAYVASMGLDTVYVIDTATNTVTATVNVGTYPNGVAVNPAGTKVYVTNNMDGTVSVIDTATNKVTATVNVGTSPEGVAVSPNGKKVYVTNNGENTVSVIDTATNKITATVNVGDYPKGVTVTQDGKKVYVANFGKIGDLGGTVSVIDTTTNKVAATVNVGFYPWGIAVNPAGTKVYVADYGDGSVYVIDTATNTVIATIMSAGHKIIAFGQFIASVPIPVIPVANFSAKPTFGMAPMIVKFTDKSTGLPDKWKWNFGDGDTSTEQDPIHKYFKAGTYTITLTVTNAAGSNKTTKTKYITVLPRLNNPKVPVASFSASPTTGKAPLKVVFTDKSKNTPTSWKWSFGDGAASTEQNPVHKYSKVGNYTVALIAINAAGNNTTTKENYITVIEKPVANFTSNVTSGKAPLTVAFTDKSTGLPEKWKWNFGDGTTSREKNPTHKYLQEGKYKITLTVSNTAGSSTVTKTNFIKVTTNTRPGIYSEN